jgi:hypothetical protein
MKYSHRSGFYFPGGKISEPTARDPANDLVTWRAGIMAAVRSKLTKASCKDREQLDLLIYARGCRFDLIDYCFADVVKPALHQVGEEDWGRIFSNIFIVDHSAFVCVSKQAHR